MPRAPCQRRRRCPGRRRSPAAFVHVSTDYVFDGRKHAPYVEEDAPPRLAPTAARSSQAKPPLPPDGSSPMENGSFGNGHPDVARVAGFPVRARQERTDWTRGARWTVAHRSAQSCSPGRIRTCGREKPGTVFRLAFSPWRTRDASIVRTFKPSGLRL